MRHGICHILKKMLMDNAQMIELYSLGYAQSGEALFKRVVEETISFFTSAWALPDGGFLSTIDADSDGEEGHYYVMSMDEVQSVAHPDDFDAWVSYFQLLKDGNVRDEMTGEATGFNVFHPITDHPRLIGTILDRVHWLFDRAIANRPIKMMLL